MQVSKRLKPAIDLIVHVLVGAMMFAALLGVAVSLAWLTNFLDRSRLAPEWLIHSAHWVEWGIFWLDMFCFGLFLLSEVATFCREIWRSWRIEHG